MVVFDGFQLVGARGANPQLGTSGTIGIEIISLRIRTLEKDAPATGIPRGSSR